MTIENTDKGRTPTEADSQGHCALGDDSAAYLADDVTVGELMRWINAEAVKAGRTNDRNYLDALCRVGERVQSALSMYRIRHCEFSPNVGDQPRAGTED